MVGVRAQSGGVWEYLISRATLAEGVVCVLSGRPHFTVRRHTFNNDSLLQMQAVDDALSERGDYQAAKPNHKPYRGTSLIRTSPPPP